MIFNDIEVEEVLEKIHEIVSWYYKESSTTDIDTLANKRDKLASLGMYLAENTAKSGMMAKLAYVERKYVTAVRSRDYKEMEGIAVSLAESKAIADTKVELEDEKKKEGVAEQMYLLMRQTNLVLSAMQQRISLLSKEKEANRDHEKYGERVANLELGYKKLINRLKEVLPPREQ